MKLFLNMTRGPLSSAVTLVLFLCTTTVVILYLPKTSKVVDRRSYIVKHSIATPVRVLTNGTKFIKPKKPAIVNGVWQVVKEDFVNKEIYLYSAYYDDRKTIEHRTVRVMGILPRAQQTLYCLLWLTSGVAQPIAVPALRQKAGPWYTQSGKQFQGEVFSCGIPEKIQIPKFISIVRRLDLQPSTYLQVQIPEKLNTTMEIGVCINRQYGELSPQQFIEWIEILKMLGVTEITMYNSSIPETAMQAVNVYIDSKDLVMFPAPDFVDDEGSFTQLLMDAVLINDCMYRNLYRYRAMMAMDLSEVIIPRTAYDYFEMISDIGKSHVSKHPATCYMFRNANYYLNLPSPGGPDFLVTRTHTYRVAPDDFGVSGRSIISPLACAVLQKETCASLVPKYDTPGWLIDVSTDIAMNQRYESCPLDDLYNEPGLCDNRTSILYKDDTMVNFAETLIQSVTGVLFKLDMDDVVFGESLDVVLGGVFNNTNLTQNAGIPPGTGDGGTDENTEKKIMHILAKNTAKILHMTGNDDISFKPDDENQPDAA